MNRVRIDDERILKIVEENPWLEYFTLDMEYDPMFDVVRVYLDKPSESLGFSKKDLLHMLAMFEH